MAKSNKNSNNGKISFNKPPKGSVMHTADDNTKSKANEITQEPKEQESLSSSPNYKTGVEEAQLSNYADYENYNEVTSEALGYNAWQRLLIKIGGIKVWEPLDRKTVEAATSKIDMLEADNVSLANNHDIMLRKILLILKPTYANVEVEANKLEDKVQAEISIMLRQLDELENQLIRKEKECVDISAHCKERELSLNRNVNELRLMVQDRDTEIRSFREHHQRELRNKELVITQLNSDLNKLTLALQLKEKDLSNLKGHLTKVQAEIDSLENEITKKVAEYENLRESDDNLKGLLSKASDAIRRLEKENKELKETEAGEYYTQLQATKAHALSLESKISKKDATIAEKESEIQRQCAEYKELEVQYGISQEEIKNLFSQLSEERKSRKESQRILAEKDKEIARQKSIFEQKDKEIASVKETVVKRDVEISGLKKNLNTQVEELLQAKADISKMVGLIADKDKKLSSLNARIKADENTISELQESLAGIESEARKSVKDFHNGVMQEAYAIVEVLKEGKYELGEGEMGETCADDEEMNLRKFEKLVDRIDNVSPTAYKTVSELREALLEILADEVSKEGAGIITPLARLCAYGRMPFMRESQGEDYMSFDYKRLTQLEHHLKSMLGLVGIQLIMPTPFCDVLKDGDYEYQAGEIPNLDYICPNIRQHLDKVDRIDSDGIVTDIVCVGYRIPGQSNVKARVLI